MAIKIYLTACVLGDFSSLLSVEKNKKPQINADERRFVDWVSAYLWLLKFIASNLKMRNNCGTAIWLPAARALAKGVVAALVLAGTGMMGMIYGTFSMDRLYTAKEYTKAGIDND